MDELFSFILALSSPPRPIIHPGLTSISGHWVISTNQPAPGPLPSSDPRCTRCTVCSARSCRCSCTGGEVNRTLHSRQPERFLILCGHRLGALTPPPPLAVAHQSDGILYAIPPNSTPFVPPIGAQDEARPLTEKFAGPGSVSSAVSPSYLYKDKAGSSCISILVCGVTRARKAKRGHHVCSTDEW